MTDVLAQLDALNTCWCHQCHHDRGDWVQFMILCPECGCKRCPHATHHDHACTGSNAVGQAGSVYGDYSVDPEGDAERAEFYADELAAVREQRIADFKRRHNLRQIGG